MRASVAARIRPSASRRASRADGGPLFQALAVDGGVAQFLLGLQAHAQRLRGGALVLGLGQGDRLAFLLDVGQRPRLFQRPRLGGGARKAGRQRDLVGAFALQRQFQRLGFDFRQLLGSLARGLLKALAFARQDRDPGVGAGAVADFFARGMHGGDPLGGLQARLFGMLRQLVGLARGPFRQFGVASGLLFGAAARLFLGPRARLGVQADLGVGFHACAQLGRFLAHRFEALGRGFGGGAQGVDAVAVGLDRLFRGLGVRQRGGGGFGVDRRAFLGQAAGARLGMGAVLGRDRRLGLGLDPRDALLDRALLQLLALRLDAGRRMLVRCWHQVDREIGVVVVVGGCDRSWLFEAD
jgi:hypothetical protein